jgi:hypothetical protein
MQHFFFWKSGKNTKKRLTTGSNCVIIYTYTNKQESNMTIAKQTVKSMNIQTAKDLFQVRKSQGAKTVKRNDVQAAIDAFLGRHSGMTMAFIRILEQMLGVKYVSCTAGQRAKFVL